LSRVDSRPRCQDKSCVPTLPSTRLLERQDLFGIVVHIFRKANQLLRAGDYVTITQLFALEFQKLYSFVYPPLNHMSLLATVSTI
jgi:hypothetical protein